MNKFELVKPRVMGLKTLEIYLKSLSLWELRRRIQKGCYLGAYNYHEIILMFKIYQECGGLYKSIEAICGEK